MMKIRLFFCGVFILALILFLSSGKIAHGGSNKAGSILTIDSITASDVGTNDETNVDVFRNDDCDGNSSTKDLEDFADLTATLAISNAGRPNFDPSTSQRVKIYKYRVSFEKLGSRSKKKKMPSIKPLERSASLTIGPDSSGDLKITLLSKEIKNAFAEKYILNFEEDPRDSDVDARFLSYRAKIKIYGKEVSFNNKVDASADITITLTEVDNCTTPTTRQ